MSSYSTGWCNFQSMSDSGDGAAWIPNGPAYETCYSSMIKGGEPRVLHLYNIDYPVLNDSDILVGIEFRFTREAFEGDGDAVDDIIQLSAAGSSNLAKPSSWPRTPAVATYGAADSIWGTSLTTSDLDSSLGVDIKPLNVDPSYFVNARQSNAQIRFWFEPGVLMRVGSVTPSGLYLGSTQVDAVYLGTTKVF